MREELPNTTATPLVMSNVFDELGRLCWQAGTTTAATCDNAPVGSAAVPVRALRYDLAGNVVGINSPAGDLFMEYDDRGLLVSSSNPGAYLGTTTSGGVADNPVRVEAETGTASGVVINSTPTAQAGASNNSYRDWTGGLVNNNVTFTLSAPAAGRFELRFRYASAAAAVRKITGGATTIAATRAPAPRR